MHLTLNILIEQYLVLHAADRELVMEALLIVFLPDGTSRYLQTLSKHDRQIGSYLFRPFSWFCLAELYERTNVRVCEPANTNRNAAYSHVSLHIVERAPAPRDQNTIVRGPALTYLSHLLC